MNTSGSGPRPAGPPAELARCDAEIAAMAAETDKPAWLVTLGIEDWKAERRLIRRERGEGVADLS